MYVESERRVSMDELVIDKILVRPRSRRELKHTVHKFETKWQKKVKKSQLGLRFNI